MAWTFYCADDKTTISASTQEDLANQLVQHALSEHDKMITPQQAMDMVIQDAKQSAA
jgi:hypothetical protein